MSVSVPWVLPFIVHLSNNGDTNSYNIAGPLNFVGGCHNVLNA